MSKHSHAKAGAFSLPVLLSFNELAWIAIFAMGLIAAYTVQKLNTANQERATQTEEAQQLQKKTKELDSELAKTREESSKHRAAREQLQSEIEKLGSSVALSNKQRVEVERLLKAKEADRLALADELKQAKDSVKDREALVIRLEEATVQTKELNRQLTVALEQSSIRKELLGLRGPMKNVALIVDRSGSMSPRWQETVSIIETWFKFLPVEKCVVIAFSNDCVTFPDKGMQTVAGDSGESSRAYLIRELRALTPEGATNTPAALKLAYTYKPDTIILFTDGKPLLQEVSTSRLMKESLNLVGKVENRNIPINCVGVGEYYKETDLIEFLINISKMTNGSFLGRYN